MSAPRIDTDKLAEAVNDHRIRFKASISRFYLVILVFFVAFMVPLVRLVQLGGAEQKAYQQLQRLPETRKATDRPKIFDRNGTVLALDIPVRSVWINPRKIIDVDEAVDGLQLVFSSISRKSLMQKITGKGRFVWVKRNISPPEEQAALALGLPGLGFLSETHRVYPSGQLAPHIIGYVNVDNQGIAGIEKFIDEKWEQQAQSGLFDHEDIHLSIDIRAQYAMRRELLDAMALYRAKAAGGVLLDVNTGEIIAMVSVPDFDSVLPQEAHKREHMDRFARSVFELGSVLKTFNTALGLEAFDNDMFKTFDVRKPIKMGRFKIRDFHGPKGYLTMPEIFTHSSNIGSARIAEEAGLLSQRAFLQRFGLFDPLKTEASGVARPLLQENWHKIQSLTASFGHGFSLAPLQFSIASAALYNGGFKVKPTLLKQSTSPKKGERVLDESISEKLRVLMRLNVRLGTGQSAKAQGYEVGGKTGTADKPAVGGYGDQVVTSFVSIFPSRAPKYLMYILFDEPQSMSLRQNQRTASRNAAPVTGKLISSIAPILGLRPLAQTDTWYAKDDFLRPASEIGRPVVKTRFDNKNRSIPPSVFQKALGADAPG